jgi:hypothetical protein
MEENKMSLINKNSVYLVGELVEVKDFREGTHSGDKNFVSATVVIKSIVDGQELLTEARTFCNELKADGNQNKNYATIKNINSWLGKRVVISGGSLKGERFWSPRTSQLVNAVRTNFNLIRLASANDKEDKATFEFGGFVTRPLQEVLDENNNVKYYQITLGQATYKEDNMFECTFTVTADNIAAARAIEDKYVAGATVEISGVCQTIVTVIEKETEVAFGAPVVKKYNNVDKKFVILGGSEVISGEGEYTDDVIERLVAAYNAEGKDIQAKASSNEKANTNVSSSQPKPKAKSSSLAGLI